MKYNLSLVLLVASLAWLLPAAFFAARAACRAPVMRSVAAHFVNGLRVGCCTANAATALAHAVPITGLSFEHLRRTANSNLAQRLFTDSQLVSQNVGEFQHGRITTANDSLFAQANFSEPMTNYAVGWTDEEGYDALTEFIAPSFQAPGDYFEYSLFDNAEEFLSDGTYDDLRSINAEFKTVDYNQSKAFNKVQNRGLRIELDYDRIKNMPNWQQFYTGKLLRRLKRNQARRAAALALAAGTAVSFTWNAQAASQPDIELNAQKIASADATGINPNRLLYGTAAWQFRLGAYGGQNNAGAYAALARDINGVGNMLGMQSMLDSGRYQNGASKSQIIGSRLIMFTGTAGVSEEDATNFKLAYVMCEGGTRYRVYIRQMSSKKWEIVVEHYEKLFAASVLGVRVGTVAAS